MSFIRNLFASTKQNQTNQGNQGQGNQGQGNQGQVNQVNQVNQNNQGNQGYQTNQGNQNQSQVNQNNRGNQGYQGYQGNQSNQDNQGNQGNGNQTNQSNRGTQTNQSYQSNQGNQGNGNQGNQGNGNQGNQGNGNHGNQSNRGNQTNQGNRDNQNPSYNQGSRIYENNNKFASMNQSMLKNQNQNQNQIKGSFSELSSNGAIDKQIVYNILGKKSEVKETKKSGFPCYKSFEPAVNLLKLKDNWYTAHYYNDLNIEEEAKRKHEEIKSFINSSSKDERKIEYLRAILPFASYCGKDFRNWPSNAKENILVIAYKAGISDIVFALLDDPQYQFPIDLLIENNNNNYNYNNNYIRFLYSCNYQLEQQIKERWNENNNPQQN
eukprot:TRINITY_DN1818_c0_g2_i1.p1 TRINITY_DN1818_c0_g2~~TRINITY_DN1818_c0_g2_i1.p1  ORF type:complete len:379 (+),score=121.10 TRINITY_DN1818_c0_g2_i1:87-1223(+)